MRLWQAIGEQWTCFDDVPRFEDKFFIRVKADSFEEAESKVKMRMQPPVGFLLNVEILELVAVI